MGLAATILVAAIGLGFLAWSDFYHELPRSSRAIGLGIASVLSLLVLWSRLIAPLRWWTKPRTALEIEARFPRLGQRIRTVVQYAGRLDESIVSEGVKPGLVQALDDETAELASSLPLDRVIRWRRVQILAVIAAVPVGLLMFKAATSLEWRIALQRSLLIERPYTTIEIKPGDLLVDQGDDASLAVELKGRPRNRITIKTRPLGKKDATWKEQVSLASQGHFSTFVDKFAKVKESFEYQVVATQEDQSPTATIRVRYPLAIRTLDVKVTPPSYTGLDPKTIKGGDVQAVEGSIAVFRIRFDASPSEASLEMIELATSSLKKGEPEPGPIILPLTREGDDLVATLNLAKDLEYKVVAKTSDGRLLPKNKHRIDVREDRAPRVAFDEPDEAIEVHPIAEVRHRVRVDDDFGLTRAGIVFRFNDGEEKTLISRDFPLENGKKPKTSATLEEMLLLETLNATPQDSITYYAFAEDNYPDNPRRTETDLRYIDLRPFKREFKLGEPGSGEPANLIALEELIARQRVNLNRANRLARHKPTDRTAVEDPIQIASFEDSLLNLTKEFTTGVEALADVRVDALHKALDAMQASIDSLDRGRNSEVPPAMSEAHKNLVGARRELVSLITNNPAMAAAMRSFNRKQIQKIRKPKNKDEEAEELVERLEELAKEEEFVYAIIAAQQDNPVPLPGKQKGKAEGKDAEKKDAEKKEGEDPAKAEAKDAEKKDQAEEAAKGEDKSKANGGDGKTPGKGEGEDGDQGGDAPKKLDRRAIVEKQEKIADEIHDLEEKLKRLEAVSELAKARMAKAAEKVEETSGDLARGSAREAMDDAREGAGMLHELARQVKGEIAREEADKLAQARDLAQELARDEVDLAAQNPPQGSSGKPGEKPGKAAQGQSGQGLDPLTEAEQVARMAEMAKTLEEWLKQIDKKGQGKTADAVGEILEKGDVDEIVERAGRMGERVAGGKKEELGHEAKELAALLEALGQSLEVLHRGIVAPELAAMVEFDRRLADLTEKLAKLKTEADVAAWKREAAALIRDLEKAGVEGASGMADSLKSGGPFHWDADHRTYETGEIVPTKLKGISFQIKERVQELILKDLASARDEATPPEFRELVDRYYEVISKGARKK
jgi:hypothetical protein